MPEEAKKGEVVAVIPQKEEPVQSIAPQQPANQMAVLQELTLEEAQRRMKLYQTYVEGLLSPEDYQTIGKKAFKKKSAWRKLGMAMNISVTKVAERSEPLPNGDFAYHFDMQAKHPDGRVMPGSGSCASYEKAVWKQGQWMMEEKAWNGHQTAKTGKWVIAPANSLHNVRTTAETRATNRAISNLIAAGEVSAEEADQGDHNEAQFNNNATPPPATKPGQPVVSVGPDEMICPEPGCGSKMYDNRYVHDGGKGRYPKKKDEQPDWKCSNKACGKAIWLDKYSRRSEPEMDPQV